MRGLGTLEVQDGGGTFEVQDGGVSSGARPCRRVAEVGGGTSCQHRKGYEFKRERREKYGHLASPPPPTGPVCPAVNVLPCPKPQREVSALWDTSPLLSQPSTRIRQPQPGDRVTREPGHLTKRWRSTQPPHTAWAGASSGQGFRIPDLGCGEDPYHALRGVCMGGGKSCISEGIAPGVLCRLGGELLCVHPAGRVCRLLGQQRQKCPAHWDGVGCWRGEHSRAALHSRALCSAACSRAESPRSPAYIFCSSAACARPFPCPPPSGEGFRPGAPRREAFLPSLLPSC